MKTDGLTHLATHEAVALRLGDGSAPFGVFFDIDGLVYDTDYFGFAHSDGILIRVAAHLAEVARLQDGAQAFRVGGDEFLVLLPNASHDDALSFAASTCTGVDALRLEYKRFDAPGRSHVAVNAVVGRVAAALTENVVAAREWMAALIWEAKGHERLRVGVVADGGGSLPPWACAKRTDAESKPRTA